MTKPWQNMTDRKGGGPGTSLEVVVPAETRIHIANGKGCLRNCVDHPLAALNGDDFSRPGVELRAGSEAPDLRDKGRISTVELIPAELNRSKWAKNGWEMDKKRSWGEGGGGQRRICEQQD